MKGNTKNDDYALIIELKYENDNIVEEKGIEGAGRTYVSRYTYDNKLNPSKNNVLTQNYCDYFPTDTFYLDPIEFRYEYAGDYPVKCIKPDFNIYYEYK